MRALAEQELVDWLKKMAICKVRRVGTVKVQRGAEC